MWVKVDDNALPQSSASRILARLRIKPIEDDADGGPFDISYLNHIFRIDVDEWLKSRAYEVWYYPRIGMLPSEYRIWFDNPDDAVLFKLTWAGQ